jgi:hypothetical protein
MRLVLFVQRTVDDNLRPILTCSLSRIFNDS